MRGPGETTWTAAKIAHLTTLVKAKMRYDDVVVNMNQKFGFMSRNAIIGKIHRLGLSMSKEEADERQKGKKKRKAPVHRRRLADPSPASVAIDRAIEERKRIADVVNEMVPLPHTEEEAEDREIDLPALPPIDELEPVAVAPKLPGIDFMELSQDNCHWPLSIFAAHPPYRFCGKKLTKEEKEGKQLYCAEHKRINRG
jgi:hypothetical protein